MTDASEVGPPRRSWWQRLPMLVLVGVLPVPFGLYFLAFIAIAVLLSDRTRDTEAKAGGAVLLFWWAYTWRQGDTTPYVAVPILAVSLVLCVQSARKRRSGEGAGGPWWAPALLALVALAAAVVAVVPYGYRSAEVDREEAVRHVLAERAAHPWHGIAAASYLVEGGRVRLIHTPVWYVALYERSATNEVTADGQPCFARREVWQVDALDGDVQRVTFDDAVAAGDPCLPIRVGTAEDLEPVPAA